MELTSTDVCGAQPLAGGSPRGEGSWTGWALSLLGVFWCSIWDRMLVGSPGGGVRPLCPPGSYPTAKPLLTSPIDLRSCWPLSHPRPARPLPRLRWEEH